MAVVAFTLAASAPAAVRRASAQTPTAPALRIQRDLRLFDRVWPVDVNRDGISDLVSASSNGRLQVSIGKGDGTFNAPIESAFPGDVLNIGDFNGDQRPDVVAARTTAQGVDFVILPGTGTAALKAPILVASLPQDQFVIDFVFALSGDLDGDGKRDLVLPTGIYPGHGDFTFGTRAPINAGGTAVEGVIADLNKDGRPDVVLVNGEARTISVSINRGAFLFSTYDIQETSQLNDVTAADVNRDGAIDLFVAAGRPNSDSGLGEGSVLALRGKGDGTFAMSVEYPVATGPVQIVAGDFNRDGIIDVATGNRSTIVRDDCSTAFKTWDSVSILSGLANGTFGAPRNFSVGDQNLVDVENPEVDRYRNTLISLNTSDLNGDGATDLIVSNGATFFNVPAATNRPPRVDAGPDTVILNTHETVLRPAASDPDEDVLTYVIRDAAGQLISTYPNACYTDLHDGENRITVTVSDGHGHSASDTVVYTVVMTDGGVGQFATGTDIGSVGATGSDAYDSATDTYTVRGSGTDIWNTADEFHYVWTQMGSNFEITALVDSVQNVDPWTKAGLMIRESLNAGSRHASLFATPGNGVAFIRRSTANGVSVRTSGPATTAPVWLKLQRSGDVITASYRKATTDAWSVIGQQTLTNLSPGALVGLAMTSHHDGVLATASFSHVTLQNGLPLTGHPIGTGTGSLSTQGATYTVTGQGSDIWDSIDSFFYVAMPWENDVTITARVRSLGNTHPWAKAGVMLRTSLSARAANVMTAITPGNGVEMQYRPATGASSARKATVPGAAPEWVRLTFKRASDTNGTFTSSWSTDGEHWTTIGTITLTWYPGAFYVGLPVSSHNAGAATTAVFDDVTVSLPSEAPAALTMLR